MLNEINNRCYINRESKWCCMSPVSICITLTKTEIVTLSWSKKSLMTTRYIREIDARTRDFKAINKYKKAMHIKENWKGARIGDPYDKRANT